jgi:uncharacterized protein YndB with AHSA1/START domain
MKTDIVVDTVYPHPIERVWAALTSADALAVWFMPNDFVAEVGHEFTFTTRPRPGFDGTVHCRVVELDPPHTMVWTWRGGPIDTTVTFTLSEPAPGRTRLHLRHLGFHGLAGHLTRRILGSGYKRLLRRKLPAYLTTRRSHTA